ncbi:hypothetical protein AO904_13580 [Pseudomonas aeruginosa]|nr:hypothetical protein AO904_13580 [Pseudomonas aeruginosa]
MSEVLLTHVSLLGFDATIPWRPYGAGCGLPEEWLPCFQITNHKQRVAPLLSGRRPERWFSNWLKVFPQACKHPMQRHIKFQGSPVWGLRQEHANVGISEHGSQLLALRLADLSAHQQIIRQFAAP